MAWGLLIYPCTRNDRRIRAAGIGAGAGKYIPGERRGRMSGDVRPLIFSEGSRRTKRNARQRTEQGGSVDSSAGAAGKACAARVRVASSFVGLRDQGSIDVASRPDDACFVCIRSRAWRSTLPLELPPGLLLIGLEGTPLSPPGRVTGGGRWEWVGGR